MSQRSASSPSRRFARDHRGVAMVEFAMLAPLLILFYVGMAEICQGLLAERRTSHATSAVGDLIAQVEEVSPSEVEGVFNIAGVILAPFPTEPLMMRVSSVTVNPEGEAEVDWGAGRNWAPRTEGEIVTLPEVAGPDGQAAFLAPGESTIMAEAQYSYESPFSEIFVELTSMLGGAGATAKGFQFESTYFLRPRRSEKVTLKN